MTARRICIAFRARAKLLLHLSASISSGGLTATFRDEFLLQSLAVNGSRPATVDLPPLSMFVLAVQRAMFGESEFALRLFSGARGRGPRSI